MPAYSGFTVFVELPSTNMEQLLSQTVTEPASTILAECVEVIGKIPYTEQAKGVDHIIKWTGRAESRSLLDKAKEGK